MSREKRRRRRRGKRVAEQTCKFKESWEREERVAQDAFVTLFDYVIC